MLNSINSDLIRGHIDTIILSVLFEGDKYGYEILGEIDSKSSGQYKIKQPTLYSCLKRLETQGFIYAYRGDETDTGGGRRKYYALTEFGKELFYKNQLNWEQSRTIIDRLVSDKQYEFPPITETATSAKPQSVENIDSITDTKQQILTVDESIAKPRETNKTVTRTVVSENFDDYLNSTSSTSYIEKIADNDAAIIDVQSVKGTAEGADLFDTESQSSPYQFNDFFDDETPDPSELNSQHSGSAVNINEMTDGETDRPHKSFYPEYEEKTESAIESSAEDDSTFKSYNVDISKVEEYNYTKRNIDKSVLEQLEEKRAERAKAAAESNRITESPALPDDGKNKTVSKDVRESERDIVLSREYRGIIRQLLSGNADIFAPTKSPVVKAAAMENSSNGNATETARASQSDKVDFDKVTTKAQDMGDSIRIRTYDGKSGKEYLKTYHYYPYKLMLYHYAILFALMLVETIVPFSIIVGVFGILAPVDIAVLVVSCVLALCFPVTAFIMNMYAPFKQKRYNADFKNSFLFRLVMFALALLIVYLSNLFLFKLDVALTEEHLITLIIPALLCTNIPLSPLIFRSLYNTKKFNAE